MIKKENFPKVSLSICVLELAEEFPRDSKTRLAMVNELSVFEWLKFYCASIQFFGQVW